MGWRSPPDPRPPVNAKGMVSVLSVSGGGEGQWGGGMRGEERWGRKMRRRRWWWSRRRWWRWWRR